MVKLSLQSPISEQYPYSREWDLNVRRNYQKMTRAIQEIQTSLQRSQRFFLSLPYPFYYQSKLLNLNILKIKRDLGKVSDEEIQLFKNVQPKIDQYYSQTFGSRIIFPKLGMGVGTVLFLYMRYRNATYPSSIFGLLMCATYDYMRLENNGYARNKTKQFLQWLIQYRKNKSIIEIHGKSIINKQQYKQLFGDTNANKIFQEYKSILQKRQNE